MRLWLAAIGSASVVFAIAACSGSAGTPPNAQGPDDPPKTTIEPPGNGYEPPGGGGQENPGSGNQDPPGGSSVWGGNCIACGGAFSCVTSGAPSDKPSTVTLAQGSGGCDILSGDSSKVTALLQCGGAFLETDNGSTVLIGTWSGGASGFSVTATQGASTLTVTCTPTTAPISNDSDGG